MTELLRFSLNGREHVAVNVDPHESLLHYLRRTGYTGAKEGCAEGECGACAVIFRRPRASLASSYEAVNACLLQAVAAEGADLWTVEGLADGETLHPVQAAMADNGSSQCGYCTPGFVMSLFAQYYRQPRLPLDQALSGNLCRCTGYRPLRDVAANLKEPSDDDPFRTRSRTPGAKREALHYATPAGSYDRPTQLRQALTLRAERPEAQVVAGGTDLGVALGRDLLRRAHWLALDQVEEMRSWELSDEHVTLGAAMTLTELEDLPAAVLPMLDHWLPLFASPLVRNRATLGGNLMTASPIGDAAPWLLALDAEVQLESLRGARWLPLHGFFSGYRKTQLADDELLTAVRVPRQKPAHSRFFKVSKRRLDDISCVAAAIVLHVHDGKVHSARLAFGGVAETPLRAQAAEAALVGQPINALDCEEARRQLAATFAPIDDVRGSAAYRRALITGLLDKFVHEEGLL